MMTTRLVAARLLFVGIVCLLVAAGVMLVISGISTPAVAVWLLLTMYFVGPIALIVGSGLVIARRRSRIGTVLAFLACGWLTWMIASDYWPRTPTNEAIA